MELIEGDELIDYAHKIQTKKEFDYFLKCFLAECANSHPEWQNTTLIDFLSGLESFNFQMDKVFRDNQTIDPEVASWTLFARMLINATVYE